jgi:two-component system CheB/CheR fusion protein
VEPDPAVNPDVASSTNPVHRQQFPIVGIGASAGGLKALQELLLHLPPDLAMAYVLIPHLDPTHESLMPQLLQKVSTMPLREVVDGTRIEPNHVYIVTPNTTLDLSAGVLRTIKPRISGPVQECIDYFLVSLAEAAGTMAIGVILSGTASDGSVGIKAIKADGGITFAQDETAEFSGMPQAAIGTGAVDLVLPPRGIAEELVRLSKHPYLEHRPGAEAEPPLLESDRAEFLKLLQHLERRTGVEFIHYKSATVRRRIARRMALRRITSLRDYGSYVTDNPQEARVLHDDILIHVTSFFRDPEVFRSLKTKVFPELLRNRSSKSPLRMWVAGCSTGEEAYSLAMSFLEFLEEEKVQCGVQVFASDVNDGSIAKARAGVYEGSIAVDVSAERLNRFFTRLEGGRYQVNKQVRDLCLFAKQDLTRDPPYSKLDLLSCRNVLIYLGKALQERVLPVFHYALKPMGFLMLGSSETVESLPECFSTIDKKQKLYRKIPGSPERVLELSQRRFMGKGGGAVNSDAPAAYDLSSEVNRAILERYIPSGVVVNGAGHILEVRGETSPILRPAPGVPNPTLDKMTHRELLPAIHGAIREAEEKGVTVRREGLRFRTEETQRELNLEVVPFKGPSGEPYFIVFFDGLRNAIRSKVEVEEAAALHAVNKEELIREIVSLRERQASSRAYQQSVAESSEVSIEELRTANEEIMSANEELQSSSEELETAKEELQSSNEELTTLNDELNARNLELGELNSDLFNVFSIIQVPIVIVDQDLRLRRATPAAEKLLNISAADVKRKLTEFRPSIDLPNLEELVLSSINNLSLIEKEVQDREARWYTLRIRPYLTIEHKIQGAVLLFLDIDATKKGAIESETAREFSDAVVDTVRHPLLVLDAGLRVRKANVPFYLEFRVTREETENRLIYELGEREWGIPRLRTLLEEVLPQNTRFESFEVEHDFPRIGRKTMLLYGRRIVFKHEADPMILLCMEDVTQRRKSEDKIRQLNSTLETRVVDRTAQLASSRGEMEAFTYTVAHDLRAPLRAMHGFSHVLLEDYKGRVFDDEAQSALRRIMEASRRMDVLIQDLLAYSQLSRESIVLEPIELDPLVEGVLQDLAAESEDRKAEIRVEGPLPKIPGHTTTVTQVITNLVSNAVKFVAPGVRPKVLIRAESRGDRRRIWFEDNGIGIAPEFHSRIFRVFERLHKSEDYRGTGIGLAIVARAMGRMGGETGVESELGRGSRFWIEFPELSLEQKK